MPTLKYCQDCGTQYDLENPPCPKCSDPGGDSVQASMEGMPAGWYDAPGSPGWKRFWNGQKWTLKVIQTERAPKNNAAPDPDGGLVIAGWITAVIIPIIGFIIGIILLAKSKMSGLFCMILSIAASYFWYAMVLSDRL